MNRRILLIFLLLPLLGFSQEGSNKPKAMDSAQARKWLKEVCDFNMFTDGLASTKQALVTPDNFYHRVRNEELQAYIEAFVQKTGIGVWIKNVIDSDKMWAKELSMSEYQKIGSAEDYFMIDWRLKPIKHSDSGYTYEVHSSILPSEHLWGSVGQNFVTMQKYLVDSVEKQMHGIQKERMNAIVIAALEKYAGKIDTTIKIRTADKQKFYYTVGNNKYYHGETIYLPLSSKPFELTAYRDSAVLFKKSSTWQNLTKVDSAHARFMANTVSESINGTLIGTIYNDSLFHDTLQCRIVVVNVLFEEEPTQKWGFDENDSVKENTYFSYKTLPKAGIKWKSVESNGDYDKLRVRVIPAGAEKSVYLKISDSVNYGIRPNHLTSNPQMVEVNNIIATREAALYPVIGGFVNDTMQIKIKGYVKVVKRVAVIRINENNDDIQIVNVGDAAVSDTTTVITWGNNKFLDSKAQGDDRVIYRPRFKDSVIVAGPNKRCDTRANDTDIIATTVSIENIKNALKRRYKHAVVEWDVDPVVYVKRINYDLNKDGMLDIQLRVGGIYSLEMKRIIDSCKIGDNDLYHLFIVDFPNPSANGIMLFNQPYGFFFPRRVDGRNASDIATTSAHECGHGVFGFRHPWDSQEGHNGYPNRYNGDSTPKDVNNLMEWDGNWLRDKLRKYQWDKVNR